MSTYYIQGNKTPIHLNQNDFVAEGGEGKIFASGKLIFKIYSDLSKMIPIAKIQELSTLSKNNIIIPKDIILNKKQNIVGFTMDLVNGVPMCKLFTNDFRNRNNINSDNVTKIVEEMINTIVFIHDKKCLIVDGNEMNYLVDDKSFTKPYFIDVNSYQTPSFPATAIMPSVKDYHSKQFSSLTDWFSFAIVSFQLFVGIHPYKGKHPNFKPNQLEDRMKKNISVFNKDVSIPTICRDFSHIPSEMKNWYIDLFERGKRLPPPKVAGLLQVKQVPITVITSTDNFEVKLVKTYPDEIIRYKTYFNLSYVMTKKELIVGKNHHKLLDASKVGVVFLADTLKYVLTKIQNNSLILYDVEKNEAIDTNVKCSDFLIIDNTIYVRNGGDLHEMIVTTIGSRIFGSVKTTWNIMPKSSQLFGGMIFQNVLGKPYIVIPVPQVGKNSSCKIIHVPELEGFRVISAKHDNGVCVIIGLKNNSYKKFIMRLDDDNSYQCRIDEAIYDNINFVTLENGIVVMINDDNTMEIFHKSPKPTGLKHIMDPNINSSMILYRDGVKVLFTQQNKLYQLRMKQ